jgi:hypothetical protein
MDFEVQQQLAGLILNFCPPISAIAALKVISAKQKR